MTVENLMKKLKKLPQDAEVIMANSSFWVDGNYIVTGTEYDEDNNRVEIYTDYMKRIR